MAQRLQQGDFVGHALAGLWTLYGRTDLGIHNELVDGGRFAVGDGIEVPPD